MTEPGQPASDSTAERRLTPALHAAGVTRTFGGGLTAVTAIDDIDLTIGERERVALVGKSGSGKSTLLSLCGLIERPDAGEVYLGAAATSALSEDQRADLRRSEIGFVFQAFHLVPALSALDNVLLPLLPYANRSSVQPHALALLEQIGLGDRLGHRPGQLSGGEQQRVAIARALINNPMLVLADEPTGNLDGQTGKQVLDLLLRLQASTGFALVVATHDENLAAQVDRVVRLADGRVFTEPCEAPTSPARRHPLGDAPETEA